MKYIDIEDMARYISKRVGCSFEDGIDYQYSQRDYMDSLGLINWDYEGFQRSVCLAHPRRNGKEQIKQDDLANATHLSLHTISAIVRGKQNVNAYISPLLTV